MIERVRHSRSAPLPTPSTMPPEPNVLTLRIQPDAGISLRFAAKVPGAEMQIRSVNMDFFFFFLH